MKRANFEIFTLHQFTSIITNQIDIIKKESIFKYWIYASNLKPS